MTSYRFLAASALLFLAALSCWAQTTTGDILGTVRDASGGVVTDARVTVRNLDTNQTKETTTSETGSFRVPLLPAGTYEILIDKAGFARYRQGPIVLALNQQADLNIALAVSSTQEMISISAEAPLIDTTSAEISTRFDTKRIADLPLSTNRNILNLAASIPGVAQISAGNSSFGRNGNQGTESAGLDYSVNGMRVRSNSFLVDGQDSYYASTGGLLQPINNPDIVGEVRFITNQFLAEFGRTAGSVMSIVTKSGTNSPHGSLFWFHNDNHLNALSNTDKLVKPTPTAALFRIENQFGGSFGGRVIKDKTFFFVSLLRWTDRRLGSGTTINGAPTDEGRRVLEQLGGTKPGVRALLDNLPAGTPNGLTRSIVAGGVTGTVPLGNITGSGGQKFNDWQYSYKVDHRFNEKHALMARYMDDDSESNGTGQLTPVGLTNVVPNKTRSASLNLTSSFTPRTYNEFRVSYSRYFTSTNAQNPAVAERIPSLEIPDLGLRGFNAATSRTAIGLAVNLPQFATLNNYQIQDSFAMLRSNHSMKFGIDFRRQEQFQFFLPQTRGRLEYANLQRLIDDQATTAQINAPLRGGELITYFRYYDYFVFAQDEWRIRPNFTLTYGLRYEAPGDPVANLARLSQRIYTVNGSDPRYLLQPVPKRDKNNFAPRVGFNYRFGEAGGLLHWLTGDRKLVMRGGYSRTYDVAFNNIALNVASSFPLVLAYTVPADSTSFIPNAYSTISSIRAGNLPSVPNPDLLVRTIVNSNFRSPFAEQFSMQLQRELPGAFAFSLGWVGTKGTALFQSVDGNPTVPTPPGTARTTRVIPTKGVIRERCNCTASIYHSLQASLEKRLSRNFNMGMHYTWSAFIDGASEIFNPSTSGEIAFPQNPYDRRSERGRSTYDRPQRFSVNGVWVLPMFREQKGAFGKVLGGWQVNGFLTFQAGAPFGVLNGADPGGVVLGNLVGTSIRPFLNTNLALSSMTVREIQAAGGRTLFSPATVNAPIGNAGRNILRANGINRLDFGLLKSTKIREGHTMQFHANFFNATNTRDWGIPEGAFTSAAFLNEGATEVPPRKIQLGLRYTF
jgi:hypothetical protein